MRELGPGRWRHLRRARSLGLKAGCAAGLLGKALLRRRHWLSLGRVLLLFLFRELSLASAIMVNITSPWLNLRLPRHEFICRWRQVFEA